MTPISSPPRVKHVDLCASIVEGLTEHRKDEDRALAAQAHLLAVEIGEEQSLHKISLLAGIGLDLTQHHLSEDDCLGEQLFFLFGEIADAAVAESNRRTAN
ncbi:hypothetical protein AUC68_07010 [Methyloceanibacter methanicus]|uniref:Uncharacterized protein n=2 Tax=Methyloceanibacter methanicus TaxID=1774968 RepID=A0A1E3VZC1_9HYPH|nr:hypothetical protein AUC68_07010 [Methyloceanibacter methanicus]